ncbi:MAG: DUF4282 domain-containing protein, partial [Propionibacteriaceae bacterium]|nr:DUF4282 domain-containing protein [Propionibacteriaceae bacterium]
PQQEWGAQPAQDWSAQPSPQQPTSDDWTTISAAQGQQSAPPAASPQSAPSGEWSLDQSVPATEQTTWTGAPATTTPEQPAQAWGQPAQQQDWNSSQQQAPQQQWGQQAAYGAPQQQWGGQPAQAQPSLFSALFDFKFTQKVAKVAPGAAYMIILIALAVNLLMDWVKTFSLSYSNAGMTISGLFEPLATFVLWAIVWRIVIEGVAALAKLADKDSES